MSLTAPRARPDAARQAQTRLRLLEAAAKEFVKFGFHQATLRDICRRAEANVAAVSYHFGDKEKLYLATLKHWVEVSFEQYPLLMGLPDEAPVQARLRGMIVGCLRRMLDTGSAGWYGQLMAREMTEPTFAFDHIVDNVLRPFSDLVVGLVREATGGILSEIDVRNCALSIIGQCCFLRHSREVISRLHGKEIYERSRVEEMADHVLRFSLGGLRAFSNGSNPVAAPPPAV